MQIWIKNDKIWARLELSDFLNSEQQTRNVGVSVGVSVGVFVGVSVNSTLSLILLK